MGCAACKSAGPGPRHTARVLGKAAGRRAGGPDSRAGAPAGGPAPHPPANGPSVRVVGGAALSVRSQGKRVTSGPSDSPDLSAALDALLAPCRPSRRLPGFRALGARARPSHSCPRWSCLRHSFSRGPRSSGLGFSLSVSLLLHLSLRISSTFHLFQPNSLPHPNFSFTHIFFLPETSFAPDLLITVPPCLLNRSLHSVSASPIQPDIRSSDFLNRAAHICPFL